MQYHNDEVIRKNIDQSIIKQGTAPSLHQKAGLVVDKVLHECVYAKTLDNITGVMIAFENFEKHSNEPMMIDPREEENNFNDPQLTDKRYLEPVQEEYIESEIETPIELPNVIK